MASVDVFTLYLFYGLAFFTIGVAITSKQKNFSKLKIARYLWLLAAFAFIHGLHEWFELYLILQYQEVTQQVPSSDHWFHYQPDAQMCIPTELTGKHGFMSPNIARISLILASYGALLAFGLAILSQSSATWRLVASIIPFALVIGFFATLHFADASCQTTEECRFVLNRVRNFFGLPGGIISGVALIVYSKQVATLSQKGARSLYWCGISLTVYGVLTGALPSGTTFTPLEIRVEFFRAVAGFVILHFLMQAMYVFDVEYHRMLESTLNKLSHASKLSSIGRMAAGVAHQINTPLTNISLGLDILKKFKKPNEPDHDKYIHRIEAIENNLQKAARIARELLLFSRKNDLNFQPVNLNHVIMSACSQVSHRLNEYDVHYRLQNLPPLLGVPWKLEEVYVNILNNAMDATPPGGVIELCSWSEGSRILSEVKDTGSGIKRENSPLLFDPFFSTKPEGEGTGLGLFISYGIMEMHNGTLTIHSAEGEGATVTLQFPSGGDHENHTDRRR